MLSVSCDLCALCDPIDSGSCFVSFSILLVPSEIESFELFLYLKEVGSHWSHGTHGAVCVQSQESIQQVKSHNMKLISNKQQVDFYCDSNRDRRNFCPSIF